LVTLLIILTKRTATESGKILILIIFGTQAEIFFGTLMSERCRNWCEE
jgi:hypothetical protein